MSVGGAGRQVDHEVVELAPVDVAEELLDCPADERAAPDDRLALGNEELDRDAFHAVPLEGHDLVRSAGGRLTLDTEHHRDVRARDVRIEQTDRRARPGEGDGEVDADRTLADTALAGRDGDDVLDAGQELLGLLRGGPPNHRSPRDLDPACADCTKRRSDIPLDLVLERASEGHQLDRERNIGAVDRDLLDHVEGDDVAAQFWLLDFAAGVEDGTFDERRHRAIGPRRTVGISAGTVSISSSYRDGPKEALALARTGLHVVPVGVTTHRDASNPAGIVGCPRVPAPTCELR